MKKHNIFPFDRLKGSDLIIDAIYEGGVAGNTSDEPLPKLMYCGNQGGFRKVGRTNPKYVILYSTLSDPDWPDSLDIYNGSFTYYGDNKTPGSLLHETKQGGNRWLKDIFSWLHDSPGNPPVK